MILELEAGKNVELDNFYVSGSGTVAFSLKFVELEITVTYCMDVSDFLDWKQANPTKKIRDYASMKLLPIYDSYALAHQAKIKLETM